MVNEYKEIREIEMRFTFQLIGVGNNVERDVVHGS